MPEPSLRSLSAVSREASWWKGLVLVLISSSLMYFAENEARPGGALLRWEHIVGGLPLIAGLGRTCRFGMPSYVAVVDRPNFREREWRLAVAALDP